MKKRTLTEAEERERGLTLVRFLNLRPPFGAKLGKGEPRYFTNWGTKTALGLYRSVKRIMEGEK